jgi:oxygen-independent coproporphyrinogen-3 oxidase
MHERIAEYMQALKSSLEYQLQKYALQSNTIETLFIGGGTPSVVPAALYEPIFQTLAPYLQSGAEITCEANPNSATKSWLEGMQKLGVNRLSFGVQSFNDKKLLQLNRAHNSQEAIEAVENAANIGIKNISIDIIYDLQGDSKELLRSDLEQALLLPINHISSYELTIEKATAFAKTPEVKSNQEHLGYYLRELITKGGFSQYEVSNYGSYQSRHNLGYWQHKEYLGVGAGAVGYAKKERYYPHSNIDHFIKNPTFAKIEPLSSEDIQTEKILLGLRSIAGVPQSILTKQMQERADVLCNEGKLELQNGVYQNREFFLSDELALFIMQN